MEFSVLLLKTRMSVEWTVDYGITDLRLQIEQPGGGGGGGSHIIVRKEVC